LNQIWVHIGSYITYIRQLCIEPNIGDFKNSRHGFIHIQQLYVCITSWLCITRPTLVQTLNGAVLRIWVCSSAPLNGPYPLHIISEVTWYLSWIRVCQFDMQVVMQPHHTKKSLQNLHSLSFFLSFFLAAFNVYTTPSSLLVTVIWLLKPRGREGALIALATTRQDTHTPP
jgi:hypothetical protein